MAIFNENNFYNKYFNINSINLYFINLDSSKDRLEFMENSINSTNELLKNKNFKIVPNRVAAADFGRFINQKILACTFSHVKAIEQAYKNNDNIAIICEDDVDISFLDENYYYFIDSLKYLTEDCEIIQGYTINNHFYYKNILNICRWNINFQGTQFYIITRNGMKKIIKKFFINNKFTFPIRCKLDADFIIYNTCNTFTSSIPLCIENALVFNSIIEPRRHNIMNKRAYNVCKNRIDYLSKHYYNYNKDNLNLLEENTLKGDYLVFTSLGDNSKDVYLQWAEFITKSSLNIDLVIYYYGNNDDYFEIVKENCSLAVKSKGLKFDNFYKFFWTYKENLDLRNYKSAAIFDDDLILITKNQINPFDILFNDEETKNLYMWGPSSYPHKTCFNQPSNHEITHTIFSGYYHYTNLIENNSVIFNFNCLKYIMLNYRLKEIPAWGSDIFFLNLLGRDLKDKYLVYDKVSYINLSLECKNVNKREIHLDYNTNDNERQEILQWKQFADKYGLNSRLPKLETYATKYDESIVIFLSKYTEQK
tara:strand:- start:5500 stop:7107 length:1608 start_codon:yes stop_codon:yes gene_type:complete